METQSFGRSVTAPRRGRAGLALATAQDAQRPDKPIFVTIKPDLTLAIGNSQVAHNSLGAAVDAASGGDKQQRIFLRGDKSIAYGSVMDIMNLLRKAGYMKIALVGLDASQAPENAPEPAAAP